MNTLSIQTTAFENKLIQTAMERIRNLEAEVRWLQKGAAAGQRTIRIHQGNRLISVSTADILYVKAEDNYSRLYVKSGEQYYTSRTLKSWTKELPIEDFIRCHRTFLVNRREVVEINKTSAEIILKDASCIPTSRRFLKSSVTALFSRHSYNSIPSDESFPVIHKLLTHRNVSGLS
jgi:DNA-binding LytR/AlgR family response regulator